ncbi:hypothetical protein DAEQUDRAFT_745750 [Daedalea quercina L-15889]|uniref:Ribosomal RNA-processing protein 17 n=1 Tax=Daedalea quercina L-15889 TaxID=1314783 RepID=A0A165PI40_9APHY|nr:hypothetical protein DAEQUDRAFT_745750 [Daedalea quercina L-15889]
MGSSNLAVLTKSHKVIAAKRRAKKEQIKEIIFDDTARREFLTGFHKRKLQKKEAAKKKAVEREKQERLEARREKRRMLAERAAQNAAETERAYGGAVSDDGEASEEEWDGISNIDKGKDKQKEEEYEYEEQVATVTVVEDFDPDELIHGPQSSMRLPSPSGADTSAVSKSELLPGSQARAPENTDHFIANARHVLRSTNAPTAVERTRSKSKPKPKDIKYQTNAARKADRLNQRRRKVEKAERAGGKASRKSGGGRKRR